MRHSGLQPPRGVQGQQRQPESVTEQGEGEEQLRAQRQEGQGPDREEEAEGEEKIYRCRQHPVQRGESGDPPGTVPTVLWWRVCQNLVVGVHAG